MDVPALLQFSNAVVVRSDQILVQVNETDQILLLNKDTATAAIASSFGAFRTKIAAAEQKLVEAVNDCCDSQRQDLRKLLTTTVETKTRIVDKAKELSDDHAEGNPLEERRLGSLQSICQEEQQAQEAKLRLLKERLPFLKLCFAPAFSDVLNYFNNCNDSHVGFIQTSCFLPHDLAVDVVGQNSQPARSVWIKPLTPFSIDAARGSLKVVVKDNQGTAGNAPSLVFVAPNSLRTSVTLQPGVSEVAVLLDGQHVRNSPIAVRFEQPDLFVGACDQSQSVFLAASSSELCDNGQASSTATASARPMIRVTTTPSGREAQVLEHSASSAAQGTHHRPVKHRRKSDVDRRRATATPDLSNLSLEEKVPTSALKHENGCALQSSHAEDEAYLESTMEQLQIQEPNAIVNDNGPDNEVMLVVIKEENEEEDDDVVCLDPPAQAIKRQRTSCATANGSPASDVVALACASSSQFGASRRRKKRSADETMNGCAINGHGLAPATNGLSNRSSFCEVMVPQANFVNPVASPGRPRFGRPNVTIFMDPAEPRRGIFARFIRSLGYPDVNVEEDGNGTFNTPIGCTFNEHDKQFVICDTGHNKVKIYEENGDPCVMLVSGVDGKFKRPSAVLYAPDLQGYVIKDDRAIGLFTYDGLPVHEFGRGLLLHPYGLARDSSGHVYTIDEEDRAAGKLRLHRFDPAHLDRHESFRFEGTGCRFMDLDGDKLVVSDYHGNTASITTLDGRLVKRFGSYGKRDGEMSAPSGVVIDGGGNILMGDSRNNRIQVFNPDGDYLCRIHFDTAIHCPSNIHLTSTGLLVVANYRRHFVSVFQLERFDATRAAAYPYRH